MSEHPEIEYWENRWRTGQTAWDIGKPSPALVNYVLSREDFRSLRVLIPGCGNAHEAQALLKAGVRDLTLLDISPTAVRQVREKLSDTQVKILCEDFFAHQGDYDLILEQTFFCALDPKLRPAYVEKMKELLAPNGRLAGVLFNRDFEGGPPFGGNIPEYISLFGPSFQILKLEPCQNSIPPRQNSEVFFELQRC